MMIRVGVLDTKATKGASLRYKEGVYDSLYELVGSGALVSCGDAVVGYECVVRGAISCCVWSSPEFRRLSWGTTR